VEKLKDEILAKVNPNHIDMLTRLIEAYDNLGIVSTIDRISGQVKIRVTFDNWPEAMEILNNLPFDISIE
jgi:hypothetical protein